MNHYPLNIIDFFKNLLYNIVEKQTSGSILPQKELFMKVLLTADVKGTGKKGEVVRPMTVTVKALDRNGKELPLGTFCRFSRK